MGPGTEEMTEQPLKYTFWLIFSTFISVFGNSLLYGYNIGVINTPAKLIEVFYNETYANRNDGEPLSPDALKLLWSTTVAIFVAFGMIGSFSSGRVADYFGRKRGMVLITFFMFLASLFGGIAKYTNSPELLMLSRVFVGLHSGINISLASLYLAEISPKKIRGAVGTCHQLAITIGILLAQILGLKELLGTVDLWPILFAFNAFPSLICAIFLPFCPESPRYLLLKQNKEEAAIAALQKLRGYDDVSSEINEMRLESSKAVEKSFSLKELLTTPELRLPIIIACLMMVAQQWSGINAIFSYSIFIFNQAKVPDEYIPYAIVATGGINVISTIIVVPLMEKLGRRPLLIYPMIVMALSMLVLTIFLNLQYDLDFVEHHDWMAWISIICMNTYVIGFAVGLGPIPFIAVSELFRQAPRSTAMALALVFNWICNFVLLLCFPFLQEGLGTYTFTLFIIVIIASILFIFFFVPETKNKTFDEVAQAVNFGHAWKKTRSLPFGENAEEMLPMDATKV